MDFRLTKEHEMVQKMVRDFACKEVAPTIKEADREQEMAAHVLPRMGELGILGICIGRSVVTSRSVADEVRNSDGCQNTDDRNNDHELNQCKTFFIVAS